MCQDVSGANLQYGLYEMLEYFAKFIFNLNYELALHLHYIYKNYLFYLLQQIYSVVLRKLLPRFALRLFLDHKISKFFTRVTFYTATVDALARQLRGPNLLKFVKILFFALVSDSIGFSYKGPISPWPLT